MGVNPDNWRANRAESRGKHHFLPFSIPHPQGSGLKVRIASSVDELERLESAWRELTSETAAPFQTYSWNIAWYRHLMAESCDLAVFVVERGECVVGILPCYLRGHEMRLAGDRAGDFQDLIADGSEDYGEMLDRIFEKAQVRYPRARFYFWKVLSAGLLAAYFESFGEQPRPGMRCCSRAFAPCPYVSIEDGLDAYLATMPSKRRQDLKRSLRKYDRTMPKAELRMKRDREIQLSDLEQIAHFHCEHFRKDGESPLAQSGLVQMLAEVAKDPDVGLQTSVLGEPDNLSAVDIGFARGGRFYGYLTAFNPEQRNLSPGKCLLLKRVDRWVAEDGVKILDLLSGDEPYKLSFTQGESHEVRSVHWLSDGAKDRVYLASLRTAHAGRRMVKRVITELREHH